MGNFNKKVMLVSVDGMRPDGGTACGNSISELFEWEGRSLI